MWTLILSLVGAPAWAADLDVDPTPTELVVEGKDAPTDAAHLEPRQALTIRASGPGTVTLRFIGLRWRNNKGRLATPGMAIVWVDGKRYKKVALHKSRQKGWSVPDRKRWIPTRERNISIPLESGEHTIIIRVRKNARIGLGLVVAAETVGGTKTVVDPEPAGAEPVPDAPSAYAEPTLTITPPTPSTSAKPGVVVVGSPATQIIRGPSADEEFYIANLDDGLSIDATGPGLLALDIHAHRQADNPESLRTLIVGIMVDEILLKTLAIDEVASSTFTIDGVSFTPSERKTQLIPINAGTHRVRLTLSDTAVLGASVRPTFAGTERLDEPGLLSADAARSEDIRVEAPPLEVSGDAAVAILGAGYLPLHLPHFGFAVRADADFAIPVAGPNFSLGLGVSVTRAAGSHTYADPRVAGGLAELRSTLTTVPLLVEARWSPPLPSPMGLEIGIGGGAVLSWFELQARGVSISDNTVVAAAVAQLTWTLDLGPGQMLVRSDFVLAHTFAAPQIGVINPTGASFGLGYRWVFGDE